MLDAPADSSRRGRSSSSTPAAPVRSSARGRAASRPRPSRRVDRRRRWTDPRLRRWLSAALAALTAGILAQLATSRPLPDGVPAVVAVQEVGVGSELTDGLLTVREVPRSALPDGALTDLGQALGRPASSVLAAGEVLTRHDVRAADLMAGLGPGTVAVWVPVADPAVTAALAGGDRVDLRSPADGSILARGVLVLAVGSGEPASGEPGGAWVAVDDEQAGSLAAQRADPLGGAAHVAVRGP